MIKKEIPPNGTPCSYCDGTGTVLDDNGKKTMCTECLGFGWLLMDSDVESEQNFEDTVD